MAELVVSMAIGPLVSMLKDKASSYLLDQYNVMEGMEEQHKTLKRKLPAILDVITDAEEQATAHREGAKAWLQELKTVAYEANQVFDEFKYEALRREAKKKGHYRELGFDAFKLFPTHNRIVFRYKMSSKLCRILQAVEVLISEMHAFRFKYRPQPPVSKEWRKTNHFINDPHAVARRSRDTEKKQIVDILLGQASNADLAVVSIVGMGGLGKTTLAQLIYNEPQVQKHFQLLLWVYVSDTFDVNSLAKCIVEAAPRKNVDTDDPVDVDTDDPPLDRLQKLVSGERYLLVLDDVWNNREFHKMETLKTSLQHGGTGSAVLTTTRDKRVAEIMGTNTTKDLSLLEDRFLKEIIEAKAFCPEKEKPAKLVQMIDEIVKRCSGSPLAATALGSVLRTKTNVKEWKALSSRSSIFNEETGILPILKLSYNDLPSYIKQCFAFCAVFPKGYRIDVDKLIQLWIANGFIPEHKEDSLETIGKHIFNELGSRSFFQDIEETKDFTGEYSITTCQIHDLMHDIALSVMEKECFIATKNTNQTECLPDTARHVFLSHEAPIGILNNSMEKRSPAIQTLLCNIRFVNPLQHPSKYNSLHVFKLRLRTGLFLPKPKHLHQLRYLDLSDSSIKSLPEDISILYNLQMLDLSGCSFLARLPRQMKYMASLRHLYTHGCRNLESMPPELGRLTKLQTLTCFVAATTTPDCSDVAELENLNLGGQLELCQIENIGIEAQAKVAILGKKKNLRELRLRWTSVCDSQVLNNFEPHDELQILRIISYGGKCVGMLQNMVEIHLSHCKRLQVLFRCSLFFPKLKQLTLEHLVEFEIWWEISEHIAFPLLEKLFIRHCRKLEALPRAPLLPERLVRSAFPALKVLEMKNLESFQRWGATVEGIELLFPQLEELSIEQCPNLIALPESPLLQETCIRGGYRMVRSAFPTLKVLKMVGLETFRGWDATVEILFPLLVELSVKRCPKLTALPYAPLLQEPCSGSYRSVFPILKVLILENLKSFQGWDATVEGEGHIFFPQLENLSIQECPKLTTLPKSPLLQEPCSGGYGSVRSAFPALKVLRMENLQSFQRWDAVEETQVFPLLENLSIQKCPNLTTLPKAPLLQEPCSGGYGSVRSAFPALKVLRMEYLESFQRWDAVEETQGEHTSFPQLENLSIQKCPKLIGLPEAPKLSVLEIVKCKIEVGHWVVRYLSSLTMLMLKLEDTETTSEADHGLIELVGNKEKWNQRSLLTALKSTCCNSLFRSGALEPWDYLVHLEKVEINRCDVLVNWPEKAFQSLVSLRKLVIRKCNNLTGYAQASLEPSTTERSQHLLPGLELLCLQYCASLVEMFNVPASLKFMTIEYCNKLQSIFGRQQLGMPELVQGSSCSEAIMPTAVSELSSSPMDHFCPLLEDLVLSGCDSLSAVLYLPPSLKTIYISGCSSIQVLSCQLAELPKPQVTNSINVSEPSKAEHSLPPCLESLTIQFCAMLGGILCLPTSLKKLKIKNSGLTSLELLSGEPPSLESVKHVSCSSLASLPNEQKAYGPLQELIIEGCPAIKKLPRSLQQQLGSIDYKRLDAQYEVITLDPKTWKKIPRLLLDRRRHAELSTREADRRRLYAKRRAERRRRAILINGEQEGPAINSGE